MGEVLLNVAGVIPVSYVNGPGKRFAIWVQGCTIGCEGCFNKELQPHVPRKLVDPEHFAKEIMQVASDNGCEGFTISGGEPFQQSQALTILTRSLKKNGFTVVCFTGFTYEALLKSTNPFLKSFLNNIDVLIAGSFDANKEHRCTWSDDTDKNIIFLSNAYSESDLNVTASCEYIIGNSGVIYTGFIDAETAPEIISDIIGKN